MKILKKIGRFFLVLTEEDKKINPQEIKAILIVNLQEGHFEKALDVVRNRFPYSEIKIISSNTVRGIITELQRLKEEQFSAVIVLSLNPFIIFFLISMLHCYFLIYNKFDQCFLIRRKTFYEFLVGRKGFDKGNMDWKISPARLNFARCAIAILLLPLVLTKNIFRFVRLIMYIFFNMLHLIVARNYYKFVNRRRP